MMGGLALAHAPSRVRDQFADDYDPPLSKDDAACCLAARDEDGRPPIGWCGPDCLRRRQHVARYPR